MAGKPAQTKPDTGLKHYVSTSDAYVDGQYFKAGQSFSTSQPKGKDWTEKSD